MKYLVFFILSVVLNASLIPCCTISTQADVSETISKDRCCSADADHGNESDEDTGCDACSPFFTCGNCSGFTMAQPIVFNNIATATKDNFQLNLKKDFLSEYYCIKWQPPKIS